MAKRRPSGDGMVRKREDGRWEGRIVVGHKKNGAPIFQHAYAHTQKELTEKLHQNIERYRYQTWASVERSLPVLWAFEYLLFKGDIKNIRAMALYSSRKHF